MDGREVLSLTSVIFAGLALMMSRPATADDTRYTVVDLGTLPGKANTWVWQQSINDIGEVAVYANEIADPNAFFTDEAFVWKAGRIIRLAGLPGGTSTIVYSLNNRGQAVGFTRQEGGFQHGVLWDHTVLFQLPELPGDTRSNTYTLNDRGQVVGFSRHPDPDLPFALRHACVWTRVGNSYTVTRLPGLTSGLTGDAYDQALGINAQGQMVGESGPQPGAEHAVLWDNSTVMDLGTLGGPTSLAIAINNRTQIVGYSDTTSGITAPFLWSNGTMTALDIPAGEVFGLAQSINNQGQIVGFSLTDGADITKGHALLWQNGVMTDLQTKIPADSGWTLLQPGGINNQGRISGFGLHNGAFRAFLLVPVRRFWGD